MDKEIFFIEDRLKKMKQELQELKERTRKLECSIQAQQENTCKFLKMCNIFNTITLIVWFALWGIVFVYGCMNVLR